VEPVETNDSRAVKPHPPGSPEEERAAARQRAIQKRIKAHGGTGLPSDRDPVEACRLGECMKCSGTWGPLYLHIRDHYPIGLSQEQVERRYRSECDIPDVDAKGNAVHLAADWHRQRLSQGQSKHMHGPGGERARAHIAQTLSRPRPDLYGKTGRNPSGKAISSWEIAKRLTQGKGLVETMDELGAPNHKLIQRRASALGLAFGTAFLCDQGEPYRYGALSHLRKAAGFETEDFDKYVGLSVGRSGAQKPDVILNPKEARKVIDWRDEVVTALLAARALHVAGKDYRKDDVLRTFLPALSDLNDALVRTMPEIRTAAREHPARGMTGLGEAVAWDAAREESAKSTDYRWRRTLRYLWQAERWIAKNLDRLRAYEDDGPLVRSLIGWRYGATQQTVQNALRERTEGIPPLEVRLLILTYAPSFAETKKKSGAPTGVRTKTKEQIELAAAFDLMGWTRKDMAPFLFPDTPRSAESNTYRVFSEHSRKINVAKKKLTPARAKERVEQATRRPSKKS
jgi:hypothetical protein